MLYKKIPPICQITYLIVPVIPDGNYMRSLWYDEMYFIGIVSWLHVLTVCRIVIAGTGMPMPGYPTPTTGYPPATGGYPPSTGAYPQYTGYPPQSGNPPAQPPYPPATASGYPGYQTSTYSQACECWMSLTYNKIVTNFVLIIFITFREAHLCVCTEAILSWY